MDTADKRFEETGLILPTAATPIGLYKTLLIDGKHLLVSGHGPLQNDGTNIIGRIGDTMDIEEGKLAAQQVGLSILSTIKKNLGSLDKVKRVIKVLGMLNCVAEFDKHPYVINGCSELFKKVWGEDNGIGMRFRQIPSAKEYFHPDP